MTPQERMKAATDAKEAADRAYAAGNWEAAASYRQEYRALMDGLVQVAGPLPKFDQNEK
jgi:hypothetical protein